MDTLSVLNRYALVPALAFVCLLAVLPRVSLGQEVDDPVLIDVHADLVFDQALRAFEEGDYGMAYRRFRLIYSAYPLNRKTTAALLMAGKSLYREERYAASIDLLERFIRGYPTSSYVEEAERTIRVAEEQLERAGRTVEVVNLGVALPLSEGDAALTQAMFNGIRIATEDHNRRSGGERPVRLVFRDTEGSSSGARAAVESLIGAGVEAIIGPLYSHEAEAAGDVADRRNVVLLAPLATEEAVSAGRQYVFQANPTWTVRGEMMARFAAERLGHRRYGAFAALGDSFAERMAEGFQSETLRLGGEVLYYILLEHSSGWTELDRMLPTASWDSLDAVYLPVLGRDASQRASEALSALARIGIRTQVLGNSEWGEVSALSLASEFSTVYATTFHTLSGDPAVNQFERAYQDLTGHAPGGQAGELAYTGYDVADFLLGRIIHEADVPLVEAVANAAWFQGRGVRLFFDGGTVNRGLYYMRYRPGGVDLLR